MLDDGQMRTIRSAVYVDFDNMFSGLKKMDAAAAEAFGTDPSRLLARLEIGEDIDGPFRRRFLQKACYLNPDVFRQYRSFFASAGFRVVDCPSLTQQGKSAADIHLVLDVVDALDHKTRFDEFIICSADADFTPLMVRVRAHDRRTVMVAASPSAPAYQAVCDQVVTPIQIAEAFSPDVPAVSTDLPAEPVADPVGQASAPLEGVESAGHQLTDAEMDAAVTAVREAVDAAGGALHGARAAGAAIAVVPRIAQVRWAEADGFSGFIARRLPEFRLIRSASGGFVIDPARRSAEDVLLDSAPGDDLPARVSRVTKVPLLNSEQYAALFQELAELSSQPPPLNRMGAEVRERAAARGLAVPRSAANFVIQGLIYAGSDPREQHDAAYFARRWYDNVLLLAERAGMELPDDGEDKIRAWILGAPSPPHPTEPDPVS